jgi:hypothetical protein
MFGITLSMLAVFAAGLLVGWNVFPQPAIVKEYYDKAVAYVKEKLDR